MEITKDQLRRLNKLQALEAGGVDNWEWYGESLIDYNKQIEQEEKLDDLMVELEVAFLEEAYEPSERGAGFTSSDKGRDKAFKILTTFLNGTL